jgi:type II secretory pathway pseudopilin PulG
VQDQRGYTLVELLIGATIGVFVVWCVLAATARMSATAASLDARLTAQTNADHLEERLASDAASAWAVWAPSPGEIDFFSEDGSHRIFHWAYTYDMNARTVTRSTGEVVGDIEAFVAANAPVSALADPSAPAYDPLFTASQAPLVPFAFAEPAGAIGGNGIVTLQLRAGGAERSDRLSSVTAPTAFTVVVRYTPSPSPVITPTPVPLR